MILSILIPSIPEHSTKLKALLKCLKKQKTEDVEILTYETSHHKDGGLTIGSKRNDLIDEARGKYSLFVDADDVVTDDFVESILDGIKSNSDVICYQVEYNKVKTGFKKLVRYSKDYKRDSEIKELYLRLPNHLMCVKTNLAKRTRWKNMSYGEDAEYSKRLKPLLKTEFQIDRVLYYYMDTK